MSSIYNDDLAIIIPACDAYLDIFTEYLRYFKKNWSDCPFELILVSEEEKYEDDRVTSITAGKEVNWTGRVLKGVEACNCPFILTMMEDQFISSKIDTSNFNDILDFMRRHKIKYYRNPKHPQKRTKENRFPDSDYACKLPKNGVYSRTLGIDIWEREALQELFGDGTSSAWDIEKGFLEYSKRGETGYFDDWVTDSRNFMNIIETVSGGKWMVGSIKQFEKLGDPVNMGTRAMHNKKDHYRRKLHGFMNAIVPSKMRKTVKRIAKKIGFNFATDE